MPNLNERAHELCNAMVADAGALGISVSTLECGTRIIDCGVKAPGNIEAGRRLSEVCLAGLAKVYLTVVSGEQCVYVHTHQPLAACMASQYAGWELKSGKFFAMGSGPMRAAACREELFEEIGHCEKPSVAVGILETSKLPPNDVCIEIAEKCGVDPDRVTLCVARTSSPAGTVQIVARSIETALHKLHVLGFDLRRISEGYGTTPLPPEAKNDLQAIGWTNDAILYGASVTLFVRGLFDDIDTIGPRVPSCASPDYGRPFAEIFARYNNDFYRIDPMLFSPALVWFETEFRTLQPALYFGRRDPEMLKQSFGKK